VYRVEVLGEFAPKRVWLGEVRIERLLECERLVRMDLVAELDVGRDLLEWSEALEFLRSVVDVPNRELHRLRKTLPSTGAAKRRPSGMA
jgi:hypothetical protein